MLQSSGAPRAKGPAPSPQQLAQAQQVEKERHDHNLRYGSLIIHWGCVCVCVCVWFFWLFVEHGIFRYMSLINKCIGVLVWRRGGGVTCSWGIALVIAGPESIRAVCQKYL